MQLYHDYKTPKYPRLCIGACGRQCGADIGARPAQCKRCATCQLEADRERRHADRKAALGVKTGGHISHVEGDPLRVPIKHCVTCGGMPWARLPIRQMDNCGPLAKNFSRFGEPVAMPAGKGVPGHHVPVCRGCGEAYAPESGVEHAPYISSSASMALRRF